MNERRGSLSRVGLVALANVNKTGKRLSIGSLPQSLIGVEPYGVI